LEILYEAARKAPGVPQHLEDGLIVLDFGRLHEIALAIRVPPQTPMSPKIKLKTIYDAPIRNVPV
jgi:hypothetical protein